MNALKEPDTKDIEQQLADMEATVMALELHAAALEAQNASYLNTLRAIHRDLGYPARAKVDRILGKCEL